MTEMDADQPMYSFWARKGTSDVTFVVDDTEFPAHRAILSERSEYFNSMFSSSFKEAKSDKIKLTGISSNAFKVVLEYIYSCSIFDTYKWTPSRSSKRPDKVRSSNCFTVDNLIDDTWLIEVFEVIKSARYFMIDDLQKDAVSCAVKALATNPMKLLNYASAYLVDELILHSLRKLPYCFYITKVTEEQLFQDLVPLAVKNILMLRLERSEVFLFNALVVWMRNNLEYSYLFPELLDTIDLFLLDEARLNTLFEPTYLFNRILLQSMIRDQRERAQTVSKIENENVINEANKTRIVEREGFHQTREGYCVIDLKQQFFLNHLKFKLKYNSSYAVCVSTDLRDWEVVIDHSRHKCCGYQWLYFKEMPVRFIRIHSSEYLNVQNCYLNTYTTQALYSTCPLDVYVITSHSIAKLYEASAVLALVNGDVPASRDPHYAHRIGDGDITFQLSQPFYLKRIELLLKEISGYYVEVSTDGKLWARVFEEEDVVGNRMATFEKRPVSFIKVVGTKVSFNTFRLYKLTFS